MPACGATSSKEMQLTYIIWKHAYMGYSKQRTKEREDIFDTIRTKEDSLIAGQYFNANLNLTLFISFDSTHRITSVDII